MGNNKRDEAIRALSEWAEEDKENRSMIVIADDERGTHVCYNGNGNNLAKGIATATLQDDTLCAVCTKAMRKDGIVRQVFAKAKTLLENYEASVTNNQDNDEAETK